MMAHFASHVKSSSATRPGGRSSHQSTPATPSQKKILHGSQSEPSLPQIGRGTRSGTLPSIHSPDAQQRGSRGGRGRQRKMRTSASACSLPKISESESQNDKLPMVMRRYNIQGGVEMLQKLKDGALPHFF